MALAAPELDDGAEEDDWIPDDELLVPEDELLPELPEAVPEDDDPDVDVAGLAADDPLAVLCAVPGRVKASPPATATPTLQIVNGAAARPSWQRRSRLA